MKRVRHSVGSAEYKKLITHTLSDPSLKEHNRVKLLRVFTVLYYTGIRLNEIAAITVQQLQDLAAKHSGVIETTKTNKERKIYLSDEAAKSIKKLVKDEKNSAAYIVHSWKKETTPMHPISLINLVNSYMKKVLGAGYTSHSFRQGIITDMLSSQVATKVVQEFIGHSNAATTLRYDRPTPTRIKSSLVR